MRQPSPSLECRLVNEFIILKESQAVKSSSVTILLLAN